MKKRTLISISAIIGASAAIYFLMPAKMNAIESVQTAVIAQPVEKSIEALTDSCDESGCSACKAIAQVKDVQAAAEACGDSCNVNKSAPSELYQPGTVVHLDKIISKNISKAEFEALLADGKYMVKFSADWCGPCKSMAKELLKVAQSYPAVTFIEVDVDTFTALKKAYSIRSLPTIVYFDGDEIQAQESGSLAASEIRKRLKTHLKV